MLVIAAEVVLLHDGAVIMRDARILAAARSVSFAPSAVSASPPRTTIGDWVSASTCSLASIVAAKACAGNMLRHIAADSSVLMIRVRIRVCITSVQLLLGKIPVWAVKLPLL